MTTVVQSDLGDVAGANSYLSVADYKTHHNARGNDISEQTDEQIGHKLVQATDYLDWYWRYAGVRLSAEQTTAWPRTYGDGSNIYDAEGYAQEGIPDVIKELTAEYAFKAFSGPLISDQRSTSGQELVSRSVRVDAISKSETYSSRQVVSTYPLLESRLEMSGLLAARGNTLIRG